MNQAPPIPATNPIIAGAIRDARKNFGFLVLFSMIINLLMFTGPLYMLQIYDRVVSSRSETTLLVISIGAFVLLFFYGFMDGIRSWLLSKYSRRFVNNLADKLFDNVFYLASLNKSANSSIAMRDMNNIRDFISGATLGALCDIPWVPIYIAACFWVHPSMGYFSIGAVIVVLIIAVVNQFVIAKPQINAGNAMNKAAHNINSSMRNADVIQVMGMRRQIEDDWHDNMKQMWGWQSASNNKGAVINSLTKSLRFFFQSAIMGLGAYLAVSGSISPGWMIAGSIILGRAIQPIDQVIAGWRMFIDARAAQQRLNHLFNQIPPAQETIDLPEPQGHISCDGLMISAPNSRNIIVRNAAFALDPGEVMAIIGPSGSGKSTLLRALIGVWPLANGSVRIDGSDLRHWDIAQLGQYIGYVPQDIELFNGSIKDNITRFAEVDDEEIDDDKLDDAMQLAGLDKIIENFSEGVDTQIGFGGTSLSGGQRQRIALTRALYGSPKYVMLDEPTASMDIEGEVEFSALLDKVRERKITTIIITHKQALLDKVDKILVLANGQMQMFGSKDQVIAELQKRQIQALPQQR